MEYDVEIVAVTKRFDQVKAVDDVTLSIQRGEFITLLGPSGCGKTTLLRMIAGFEKPTAGKILLGGDDVTHLPPYKRNVHTVFQQYALFPHRTVAGNIAFGLEQRRLKKTEIQREVAAALEMVQLQGFEDRYPQQLSGGQQQRVAIARAVILAPRVLLLDEPLGALDLKLRKEMQVELKKLQRRLGISFIFVTHDQEEALVMSDRIAVMRNGRIEQLGTAYQIYEQPRTEFVADFIGVSNIFTAKVVSVNNGSTRVRLDQSEIEIPTRQSAVAGNEVKIAVRPEKIELLAEPATALIGGKIVEQVYFGNSTHWRVQLADGTIVTVAEQNRNEQQLARHSIGQSIYLRWDQRNSVMLERS